LIPTWLDGQESGPSYYVDDYEGYAGFKYLFSPNIGFGLGYTNLSQSRTKSDDDFPDAVDEYNSSAQVFTAGMSLLNRRYFTAQRVDEFGRTEDIPIGWLLALDGGVGPDEKSMFIGASGALAFRTPPVYGAFLCSYRRLTETETYSASFRFFSEEFLSTRFCGRLYYSGISKGAPESKFRVGGQTCLRSYCSYEQVGERLLAGNLEARVFTPIDILSIKVGCVAFLDAGTAWDPTESRFTLARPDKPILGDYGLEFRFASTSSTTGRIVRVSLARTFDGEWDIELASDQLFLTYFGLEHGLPLP